MNPAAVPSTAETPVLSLPVGITLAEADRRLILATLQQCGGVKKIAAGMLGVSLKTLYNRLERYRRAGLIPPRS